MEKPNVTQHINFAGRFDRDKGATMFFVIEESEETTFEFSQNAVTVISNGHQKNCKTTK